MIIWLASYPRSGNTLFRTILKATMGMNSYSDEIEQPEVVRSDVAFSLEMKKKLGHLSLTMPWNDFYQMATNSNEVYFIKTHSPPRDTQPVIYIVRDGRSSLVSYHKFHQEIHVGVNMGLIDLALGTDHYGGWSDHFASWINGKRKSMVLHYEDIVSISSQSLREIADFIDYGEGEFEWSNPFDKFHDQYPRFFRSGKVEWQEVPEWTELVNGAFFFLNGKQMESLGYVDSEYVESSISSLSEEVVGTFRLFQRILEQKQMFEREATNRQKIIEELKDVCDERLALLEKR